MKKPFYLTAIFGLSFASLLYGDISIAESFLFGSNANNLNGVASSNLTEGDFALTIAAGPFGAVINESDSDGLGIDSTLIPGVVEASGSKFNLLGGSAAGQSESITFSFDTAGVLEGLLFDGLKDESLEYFSLQMPNGTILSLFDFEVEMRLNDQGFQLLDLGVPNPTQAIDSSDDILGLSIPFTAGEVFTLTYGEIDYDGSVLPGYYPADDNLNPTFDLPNGSRFEGIIVSSAIPEPSTLVLSFAILFLGVLPSRSRT